MKYWFELIKPRYYVHVAEDGLVRWRGKYKEVFPVQTEKKGKGCLRQTFHVLHPPWEESNTQCHPDVQICFCNHPQPPGKTNWSPSFTNSAHSLTGRVFLFSLLKLTLSTRRISIKTQPASSSPGTCWRSTALRKASGGARGTGGTAG